jgi:Histidine phosphatase superfamily (branch 1)
MTPHTIYFIRHGETDWNAAQRYQGQTDIPLNAKGREQATRNGIVLAQRLGTTANRLQYIASPLSRTSETMRLLRQSMGLPVNEFQTDDRLKEQHFGHWEGQLWSELPRIDPEGFAAKTRLSSPMATSAAHSVGSPSAYQRPTSRASRSRKTASSSSMPVELNGSDQVKPTSRQSLNREDRNLQ